MTNIYQEFKILVGILYSGEPQFEECINSVKAQEGVEYDYFVIKNLPKNEAHDKLYKTFMRKAGEFDIFLKLDSDMVIQDKLFFDFLKIEFVKDSRLDHLHLFIYDYFLDENISGINIYRNSVKWDSNKDNLFTDRTHKKNTILKSKRINYPKKNWIIHCPDPSIKQAINFGLHRSIKAFQFQKKDRKINTMHAEVLKKLILNYFKTKKSILIYSIYGFYYGFTNKFEDSILNKNNKDRKEVENRLLDKSIKKMKIKLFLDIRFIWLVIGGKYTYALFFYYYKFKDKWI